MEVTISLESILNFIHTFSLSADNKKWLADHLYAEAREDETGVSNVEKHLIDRAMLGHKQIQEGHCVDSDDMFRMLDEKYTTA